MLFVIAGLLALLLIVGYRTRVVSLLCWVMLLSLNHRNYLILQSSDSLMLALLFWSLFLPLGARYSVDSALNPRPIEQASVCNFASAALLVTGVVGVLLRRLAEDRRCLAGQRGCGIPGAPLQRVRQPAGCLDRRGCYPSRFCEA